MKLGEIDERIKEILRDNNINNDEIKFTHYVNNESIDNNSFNNTNEMIRQSNIQRTKSKFWYFLTTTNPSYFSHSRNY